MSSRAVRPSRRWTTWLALFATLAFLACGIAASGHDHHDAAPSECATCTLAHAPALAPAAIAPAAPALSVERLAPSAAPVAHTATLARSAGARAPPIG